MKREGLKRKSRWKRKKKGWEVAGRREVRAEEEEGRM